MHVTVLADAMTRNRLWNCCDAGLQLPMDNDLSGCRSDLGCDPLDRWVGQHLRLLEWTPSLRNAAHRRIRSANVDLLQIRMKLNLVDGGCNVRTGHQLVEVVRLEVRDPDCSCEALFLEVLHCTPGLFSLVFDWPMDEIEIHVIHAEFVKAY